MPLKALPIQDKNLHRKCFFHLRQGNQSYYGFARRLLDYGFVFLFFIEVISRRVKIFENTKQKSFSLRLNSFQC